MKIRNRLTLAYGLATFFVMTALGVLVYFFTARFHQKEFFDRLKERVQLTEQIFLEKDEAIGQAFRDKFLQRLDFEEEYAITLKTSGLDSLERLFYKGFSNEIKEKKAVNFKLGNRQGFGKIYDLPSGKYAVVVTAIDVFGHSKLQFLRKILLAGVLCGLTVLVSIAWYYTRWSLQPLEDKIRKASVISASNLGLRLEVKNPDDEIGELAIAFNRMLERLQVGFESQRGFVSNASHEIRNPLTAIIGEAEVLLERERTPAEYQSTLHNIVSEAEKLQNLAHQLLDLSKAEAMEALPNLELLTLDHLLLEVVEQFPAQRLRLHFEEFSEEPHVLANRTLLQTAFANIVDNAIKYTENQLITIDLKEQGDSFEVKISDTGIGISANDLKQIYVPLFRARNARKLRGHGVGLPLARRVFMLHKGSLLVESEGEGKGTTVTIALPKAGK